MANIIPQIGRIALVQIDGETIGYAQGYSAKETSKNIKEYVLANSGGDWPAVSASGNKDYQIDIDGLYVDNSYHVTLEAGTTVTVILGPVGSSGGNPKITVPCLISSITDTVQQAKITTYKLSLETTGAPTNDTW